MLAIIPARGGSKGVPKKNIKPLAGKPLILWTIEAAKKTEKIDRIILSTDDDEIANTCRNQGIEIPFLRPKELAQDDSKAIDNYIYTIEELKKREENIYEDFVVLQPTSPLRKAEDIDNAIELFINKDADSVISFSEASHHPLWAKKIDTNQKITNYFHEDASLKNRQELPIAYMPNGALFIFKYSLLRTKYTYYTDKTFAYIIPSERSVDIDTEFDFKFAEFLLKQYA